MALIRRLKYVVVLSTAITFLGTFVAEAKQCGRLDRSTGHIHKFDCSMITGRAAKQSRRHFRAERKAGLRVVSARLPARVAAPGGAQTDNDGRVIYAAHVAPVRLAGRAEAARGIERVEVLPHPAGCPRRLFCGCGAAVKVFGAPIRALWLAANWLKYPRADPAPGMVAVRRGHVFVIEANLGGGRVIAYDANSGKGLTRRHVRSLAGYSVRNPNSG